MHPATPHHGIERPFGLWADPVVLFGLVALWFALAVTFNGEPWLDKAVAAYFFTAGGCAEGVSRPVCGAFGAAGNAALIAIRQTVHYVPMAVALALLAMVARDVLSASRPLAGRAPYASAALLALALGPGLLVNGFLKSNWGRPRPGQTDLFGGDLPFVPAGQWSDACQSNCSFISGEASSAFWLVVLVPLLPAAWRPLAFGVALAVATIAAGLRVAFGGHYLSDVVLGALSTPVVFAAVALCIEAWRRRRHAVAALR